MTHNVSRARRQCRRQFMHQEGTWVLLSGLMGNASEVDAGKVQGEFSQMLASGERVEKAYQLKGDPRMKYQIAPIPEESRRSVMRALAK